MNNEVKQAFSISADKKVEAKKIYELALIEMVNKNYKFMCEDAFVELSSIFGQLWCIEHKGNVPFWLDAKLFAEANVAFNYANSVLGCNGKFVNTVISLVKKDERVSDLVLKRMAKDMNCLLTNTTEKDIKKSLSFMI
jgi:hypothetical protein